MERYRLAIADDEEMILDGLRSIVDWEALGFEVAGCFRDGQTLLSMLSSGLVVDAVLTDIRMDGVTGIDIARYVSENCPETKVVLLSGYQEFAYAQQAIAYGVIEYLNKPCAIAEIQAVFTHLHKQIAKQRQAKNRDSQLRAEADAMRTELSTWLFSTLLTPGGSMHALVPELSEGLVQQSPQLAWHGCVYAAPAQPVAGLSERELLAYVQQVAEKQLPDVALSLIGQPSQWLMVLQHENATQEKLDAVAQSIRDSILGILGVELNWVCRYTFDSLHDLSAQLGAADGIHAKQTIQNQLLFSSGKARSQLISTLALQEDNPTLQPLLQQLLDTPDSPQLSAMRAACEYIRAHCEEPLSLTAVARRTYMHPSYLSRVFKRNMGMTFKAYLTSCRIERANELLHNGDLKVYDIAVQVGYRDVRHFYEVYKRGTGMTPSEYRQLLGLGNLAGET